MPAACWDPASRPEGYCPDDLPSGWPGAIFDGVEIVSVVIFTVEYIARMYAIGECDEYLGWRGKFRFLITPFSLIDLASIVPFYVDLVRLPSPLRGPPRRCGSVRRPPAASPRKHPVRPSGHGAGDPRRPDPGGAVHPSDAHLPHPHVRRVCRCVRARPLAPRPSSPRRRDASAGTATDPQDTVTRCTRGSCLAG